MKEKRRLKKRALRVGITYKEAVKLWAKKTPLYYSYCGYCFHPKKDQCKKLKIGYDKEHNEYCTNFRDRTNLGWCKVKK